MPVKKFGGGGVLSIFYDLFTAIVGADWTTDTAVNGTVTNDGDQDAVKHTSEAGSYALLKSLATYRVPFLAVFKCNFEAGAAVSLRRIGFADADWSNGIFLRMNGTTYEAVVKIGGVESTSALVAADFTTAYEWIIHATATTIRFYVSGETLKATIAANIPTASLYFQAKGEKI